MKSSKADHKPVRTRGSPQREDALPQALTRQRMDKWLWHTRMVRTRLDAAALISSGHVRLNGVREKSPGHEVKLGDVLTVALSGRVRVVRVLDFAARRGGTGEAQTLYADLQSAPD